MRKGIHGIDAVAGFVVLGVALVVCILIFTSILEVWNKTEAEQRCSGQIRAHAAAASFTSDLVAMDVVCPTTVWDPILPEDMNAVLAEEMKTCWDTWGRGELQLFGNNKMLHCHVCSMVYGTGEPVEGLPEYLETTPTKPLGPTYMEYMSPTKKGAYFRGEEIPETAELSLPTDEPLAVIFYYAKGQDFIDGMWNALIGTPDRGAAVGGIAGAGIGVVVATGIPTGGLSVLATGVVYGATILTATVSGGFNGFLLSLFRRADIDTMQAVVVRPLGVDDVSALGCTYAPVANE